MANLQAFADVSRPPLGADDFEEGWDCGVDWANERAEHHSLRSVKALRASRCRTLGRLTDTIGCTAADLFGRDNDISERRVEGFIDGAVAILHEGRV